MLIAKWLDFNESEILKIIQVGLLHDAGKIKVNNEILNKKEKLTSEEFDIIKKHVIYGYDIVKNISSMSEEEKLAVLMHHEKMDGSGYPFGSKGNEINVYSKIIAIADVYDAITSKRVYKSRSTPFEAFEFFETVGVRYFDIRALRVFISHLSALYTGFRVMLSDGSIGEIVYVPPLDIIHPVIQINSIYLDLSTKKDIKILSIL